MKTHTKWLFAVLFVLAGIFLMPQTQAEAQAAARISHTSVTLKQGKKKELALLNSNARVQWSSNKPQVVSVDANGVITAVKGGKAVITARTKRKEFRCKVKVVGFNTNHLTMSRGSTYTLKVKNGTTMTWSSSNEKVAKVTKKGVVKAKKTGKAVIKCRTANRTIKCKVYVASLGTTSLRLAVGTQYQMAVNYSGDACYWSSANPGVASVDANGVITATGYSGTTTVTCRTGRATLACAVQAVSPNNITTPMSTLPMTSAEDIMNVTVESYPGKRTYTIYRQSADVNKTSGNNGVYTGYMPSHGCAACAVSTVLSGYAGYQFGPADMTERVERNLFGEEWIANYSKSQSKQMPISLYGITRILSSYGVSNQYVRQFDQATAVQQITNHLKTGNAVVIEVKKLGSDKKWSNSKHTMVLLGMTDTGYAIVADSADRADYFGEQRRIKYASVFELVQYMFSCSNPTSTAAYYTNEASCGGYILVNPQ